MKRVDASMISSERYYCDPMCKTCDVGVCKVYGGICNKYIKELKRRKREGIINDIKNILKGIVTGKRVF